MLQTFGILPRGSCSAPLHGGDGLRSSTFLMFGARKMSANALERDRDLGDTFSMDSIEHTIVDFVRFNGYELVHY